ncbi:MAG: pilus assembly FimT family protein [Planctomycetota bacterium]|jgi:prepilin-type N-terminal cleavage/methylation domain-containing protein
MKKLQNNVKQQFVEFGAIRVIRVLPRSRASGALGFTLTELIAVLLVMGLAAGAVALSVGRTRGTGRMADAVDRLMDFDGRTRQRAIRSGKPVQVVFDLAGNRVFARAGGGTDEGPEDELILGEGVELGKVVLAGGSTDRSRVAIWCSARGSAPTCAVRLDGRPGRTWLLFAGPTGQVVRTDDEAQITQAMALLAGGPDAD